MFWRDLDGQVRRLLAGAERRAVVAAPFIKADALQRVLHAVPAGAGLTVYTRWRVDEVAAGVSDPQILEAVEARGGEVWLCDELHAKVFVADDRALVGSANVTAAALGLSRRPNLELLQPVNSSEVVVELFLAELRMRSRRATAAEAEAVLAKAAELAAAAPAELMATPDADEAQAVEARPWFPGFRSPDRLYGLATDPDWVRQAKPSDPALQDLLALQVDASDGEAAFDAAVRGRLRAAEVVRNLDGLLAEPQRFGALTDWLRTVMPEADHRQRQEAGQTLIRWLTYFDPERYEVGTPGAYSEVLSRRR